MVFMTMMAEKKWAKMVMNTLTKTKIRTKTKNRRSNMRTKLNKTSPLLIREEPSKRKNSSQKRSGEMSLLTCQN